MGKSRRACGSRRFGEQPVEQSHSHLPRVLLGFASRNPEEAHALIDQEGRKAVHQRPSGKRLVGHGQPPGGARSLAALEGRVVNGGVRAALLSEA